VVNKSYPSFWKHISTLLTSKLWKNYWRLL
jgi:hypothetical protein